LKVKLKLYAMYKDALGEAAELELPEGSKVADLKRKVLELLPEGYPEPVVLKDGRFAEDEEPLTEGEYELVPPAAGGGGRVVLTEEEDWSLDGLVEELGDPESGATVIFVGTVKSKGSKVLELIYEAHPSVKEFMEKIVEEELKKWGALDARVVQFLGPRKVGQKTLIIAVSGKDRESAFKAAREILERLKHEPPIWKREVRTDGEYWITGEGELRRSPKY